MKQIIIMAAIVLLVTNCGLYKKYERPEEIDELYNLQGKNADYAYSAEEDSASVAFLGWRELFADPYLQSLIAKGLEANTDLKTAELRVEQAKTALRIARLSYLPSFNFAPEAGVGEFRHDNYNIFLGRTYSIPVAASWELDIFGGKTNNKRAARASFEMTKDYMQAVKTGLIAGIATQYYTLLMLDEQLCIARESANKMEESVRVIKAMTEAGMANEIAVSQMEGAWYEINTAVENIKRAINELQNSLSVTLGMAPQQIERGTFDSASFPDMLARGIPVRYLSHRPDVRAAENYLAAAYYNWNGARAKMYPAISLSGVAGWTNSLGTSIINPGGVLLNAAASLVQPLFNSGAIRGEAKINKAERDAVALAFKQTVLDAGAEVNNALTQYQTALAKEKLREKQLESLALAAEKTQKLMKYTSTPYLEVLTAQLSLLDARNACAQDKLEKIEAVITLYRALGGGQQ